LPRWTAASLSGKRGFGSGSIGDQFQIAAEIAERS
jgi:hypothetical protein